MYELKEYVKDVFKRLKDSVENLENLVKIEIFTPELYSLIKSLLLAGKRLRAILTVLSYQAVGGDLENSIPLAIAIELAHNASLIHDDIVDNDKIRRGNPALHKEIGIGNATVLGDAMILLSIYIVALATSTVDTVKLISKYGFELCDGEFLDLSLNIKTASIEDYFLKINRKTAILFKSSAHIAALAANGSTKEIDALSNFGENIGIIYQIKDDMNDILEIENGNYSIDLKQGIVTLPLIHFYKNTDKSAREFLIKIFGKGYTIKNYKKLLKKIEEAGSFKYCKKEIEKFKIKAQNCLKDLEDNSFKKLLIDYLYYILRL